MDSQTKHKCFCVRGLIKYYWTGWLEAWICGSEKVILEIQKGLLSYCQKFSSPTFSCWLWLLALAGNDSNEVPKWCVCVCVCVCVSFVRMREKLRLNDTCPTCKQWTMHIAGNLLFYYYCHHWSWLPLAMRPQNFQMDLLELLFRVGNKLI
jgi:hypothetical protein